MMLILLALQLCLRSKTRRERADRQREIEEAKPDEAVVQEAAKLKVEVEAAAEVEPPVAVGQLRR